MKKLINKYIDMKTQIIVGMMILSSDAMATSGGGAAGAANNIKTTLTNFLGVLPVASKIGGIVAIIGGMWSLYKHYKSQGRDGSIAAGVAGLGVGVGLFFLGGLLNLGAGTLGIGNEAVPGVNP